MCISMSIVASTVAVHWLVDPVKIDQQCEMCDCAMMHVTVCVRMYYHTHAYFHSYVC